MSAKIGHLDSYETRWHHIFFYAKVLAYTSQKAFHSICRQIKNKKTQQSEQKDKITNKDREKKHRFIPIKPYSFLNAQSKPNP